MKKVLVVEDHEEIGQILMKRLSLAGYESAILKNGLNLVSLLSARQEAPAAVILDLMMPGRTGYELLNSIKSLWPQTKIFIFSSHQEYLKKIPSGYVQAFFLKTDGIDNLLDCLGKSLV